MQRQVLVYPHILLKQESQEVKEITSKITVLIQDLKDTMYATGHSIGIAAPQIGELSRVVVINVSLARKKCENHGELVLINPEITAHEGFESAREGCMSVPEYTGVVHRAAAVKVAFLDKDFKMQVLEASGFEAVVLQHEIDHLDGLLFIDRVISRKSDLFKRK